jgi:hypothetical protein
VPALTNPEDYPEEYITFINDFFFKLVEGGNDVVDVHHSRWILGYIRANDP